MKKCWKCKIAILMVLCFVLTGCSEKKESNSNGTQDSELEVKNVLMVGNSFCYYHVEELYGIAEAAGYDLTIANLYKGGCRIDEHWTWYQFHTAGKYQLFITDAYGRIKISTTITLNDTLKYLDWDVISLQQHFDPSDADTYEEALATTKNAKKLLDAFKEDCPEAKLFWLQTWAYQVGYKGPYSADNVKNDFATIAEEKKVLTVEKQTANYNAIKQTAQNICEENSIDILPMGDAWQIARGDSRIGDTLCERLGINYNNEPAHSGDYYHDGDIGGGQYLNACVWFEVIMQESCIGNAYRPSYTIDGEKFTLTEEQITAIQEAAHQAVAAVYGDDYAK